MKSNQSKWMAKVTFVCVDINGERFRVVARIGIPEKMPKQGKLSAYGLCPVSIANFKKLLLIGGEIKKTSWIGGENEFQALCLSIDYIRVALRSFVAHGGRIYFRNTDLVIDVDSPSFCPLLPPIKLRK